mmetsp:Transcript_19670/g.32780  ORF Transcript_19670/g.32780 Transcript_19670/m.32780 type:complete len:771 (+) Transcript_19670:13-2325(+)|eukprot:CAMPEP_0119310556 /NCGR_PEP_ID=MMETSP1333-20130426/19636_1 /TAXON_ID=418940 /ORGANISM="Scyphosphaera apsteinii, Strain RCC1455" /LENGTH=770 /DNA_ID=CAMNT_0007314759 /DNA_START=11 /DNA_END=2323 /DNA_ORIENTATION=+
MESDQSSKLSDAKKAVAQQAYQMKRALDQRNLRTALQHAATMLGELRTASLSPKNYYDLYIAVTDELRHMEEFFLAEHKRGRRMQEIYELVQHAGNVLPRLYLLLAAGSVYILSKEAPAKDILKDLVEMCRGVQHPMKGLFLRNYLSQTSKDKLPDTGSEFEGFGGSASDAVSFILSNFSEMNKLWVRMQHQGAVSDRKKREKERLELKILVGTNLLRLSQLEGVTLDLYSTSVLPQVLEQVVNCKDSIAQQYLVECITQVFPIEYHINTLPIFLKYCTWLSASTDVKVILLDMLNRLGAHEAQADENEEASIFTPIASHVASMIQKADGMQLADILQLQFGLVRLAIQVYPSRLQYVDSIFEVCTEVLVKAAPVTDARCVSLLRQVSTAPLESYKGVLTVLELTFWPKLNAFLSHEEQKKVVTVLLERVSAQGAIVSELAKADQLLTCVAPILREETTESLPDDSLSIDEDLALEMTPVSRMIHAMHHEETDDLGRILNAVYRHSVSGTVRRSPFTLVPLVFRCLKLARRIKVAADEGKALEVSCHKLLAFVARLVDAVKPLSPNLALRLYLQCAQTADLCAEEADAYEMLTQAFVVYEEEISDSRAQLAAITLATATLPHMSNFSEDQYETLAASAAQYSAKLLKKPDQSRAVCKSANLFWPVAEHCRNPKRVLECLQKALKIADACKVSNTHTRLFVEILDAYLWHFGQGNELVTGEYVQGLMQLIDKHLAEDQASVGDEHRTRYENTQAHISKKVESGDERYSQLK